eukprot:616629-Pleurochrysis_carterae.AAC.1
MNDSVSRLASADDELSARPRIRAKCGTCHVSFAVSFAMFMDGSGRGEVKVGTGNTTLLRSHERVLIAVPVRVCARACPCACVR